MKKILLIGGWTRDKKAYQRLLNLAPAEVEIVFHPCYDIIYDDPGKSAEILNQILTENNLDKAVIIAHSLGGIIALEFALKYPDKVERLVLVDSAGLLVNQSFLTKAGKALKAQQQFWQHKLKENFATTARFFRRPLKNIRSMSLAYSHNLAEKIHNIDCETEIIWGELDYIYPLSQGETFKELIPKSKLHVLHNMDHDWIIHSPKYFWEIVKSDGILA